MTDSNDDKNIDDDLLISKTQLKKEAKDLHAFGKQLITLSEAKLVQLPLSERTILAVKEYHKQNGNIAKKRHLAFIGKCLRVDTPEAAIAFLQEDKFSQLRQVASEPGEPSLHDRVNSLLVGADSEIEILITNNSNIERQTLRQLVRNCRNAKTESKRKATLLKLTDYLKQFEIQW